MRQSPTLNRHSTGSTPAKRTTHHVTLSGLRKVLYRINHAEPHGLIELLHVSSSAR